MRTRTDQELIDIARPPAPLASALLRQSEADVEALLQLLFCCHQLLDEPEQVEVTWHDCSIAWPVKGWYLDSNVPEVVLALAPTWESAISLTTDWLQVWPHDCGEYDYWAYRRDELDDPSAMAFFRGMLTDRSPPL
jgi:hypothetical protein